MLRILLLAVVAGSAPAAAGQTVVDVPPEVRATLERLLDNVAQHRWKAVARQFDRDHRATQRALFLSETSDTKAFVPWYVLEGLGLHTVSSRARSLDDVARIESFRVLDEGGGDILVVQLDVRLVDGTLEAGTVLVDLNTARLTGAVG